jgi:peroxiredoxin
VTVRRQWAIIGGGAAALAVVLYLAIAQLGPALRPLRIGGRAPDFTAMTVTAAPAPRSLADYRGQVVLLNIWATWCLPCRVEMPSMQRLEERLGPKGLRIVAVSVDLAGYEERIVEFGREFDLTFELLHDAPGAIQRDYQSTGVPETFVIDRAGRVRRRIIGADDWSSTANVAFLERLLAETVD